MIGPDMGRVYQILRAQNNNEDRRFPVLEVHENSEGTLEVLVGEWTQEQNIRFATISHVWSDGLGNEDKNEIYYCQFKFIYSLLKKVFQSSPNDEEDPGIKIQFWLDTLLIPVRSTGPDVSNPGDFDQLKRKAIRQIYKVFHASNFCIVIDRGLLSIDSSGTPWKNVMKIFGSGWMRRLWTLQEAYLSKELWVTFRQLDARHKGMHDFDTLIPHGMGSKVTQETFGASIGEIACLKLFQNIMGTERNQLKAGENPQASGGAILVANTWRAARWRVSCLPLT